MKQPVSAMSESLLALPLSGESFLLRRLGCTVLVDGGWKKDRVVDVLKNLLQPSAILDVVVCTHGDGDHAGGLPDLIRTWPGRIRELWLPGRWVEVVPELLRDPRGFVDGLIAQLDEDTFDDPAAGMFDRNADDTEQAFEQQVAEERSIESGRSEEEVALSELGLSADPDLFDRDESDEVQFDEDSPRDEPGWFADMRRAAAELASSEDAAKAFASARRRIQYRRATGRLSGAVTAYWLGLIDCGEAIEGIARAALGRPCKIRWFDFDAYIKTGTATGGIPRLLVPVNAVEQAQPDVLFELSYLARLSQINREALVFWSPGSRRRFGALFCGDSPLGDGRKFSRSFLAQFPTPNLPVIATAPHHGAETNRAAYPHLTAWAHVLVLLRAGGDRDQPGPAFKKLIGPLKICAACPRSGRQPTLAGVCSIGDPHWLKSTLVMGEPCDCS